ncbi:MAG TPA: Gfo/Idh/MocA family oxidoreductase [Limnochordia bacterium]|nr:Gfo/Idh/MocA family oxidoreductase [Limnochordia bacterium]
MKDVVLGFVGCGFMGQVAHIANYAELSGVRLKGLTDLKPEQARRVAARYGIEQVYPSVEALVADPEIDAVVCTLFWSENRKVATACLAAGKHIATEKPLAGDRADGAAIVAAARAAGKHACVGYMKCFDAGVEQAKALVDDWGKPPAMVRVHFGGGDWTAGIGRPITTDEKPDIPSPGHSAPPHFDAARREAFHFFVNQHVHHLGVLRYLLGRELQLHDLVRQGRSHLATFTAGETLVTLEHTPLAAEWWEESFRLHWDNGTVEIDTPPPLLRNVPAKVRAYRHAAGGGRFTEPSAPASWAFKREAEHFVRVVCGDEAPRVPAEHALNDVVHCEEMALRARNL